jgi:hypothetical protein
MMRPSKRRIDRVIATARRYFGLELTRTSAIAVIVWDTEKDFVTELSADGELDTRPLDYFGMALVAQLMPGAPTVQDQLIGRPLERWHFPLNGSSDDYRIAFMRAWRRAVRNLSRGRSRGQVPRR